VKGIGKLRKGDLTQFGYKANDPPITRRAALRLAVAKYGALSVFRKLNAVAVYNKLKNPEATAAFTADRYWVRMEYL
jgi:hypothetical protein